MKKEEKVITKFKNGRERDEVILKRNELKSKEQDLLALKFGRSLFLNNSMCFENPGCLLHMRAVRKL